MQDDTYDNPLVVRYASAAMAALWSPRRRIQEWRRLWILLAETQQELGLPITDAQLDELRVHANSVDWDAAARLERELRHDVMAHVHAFGEQCPAARPILHWGATSCYVTDNADLVLMREAMDLILSRAVRVIDRLARFAEQHRELACLAYTHLQAAQPTTVGKRACLWAQDLCMDVEDLEHRRQGLRARSAKGTTGTQASFLQIFGGDHARVVELDRRITQKLGFMNSFEVTGQTYPRKVDSQILDALSGFAQSAHKAATDLRLLIGFKELDEPMEHQQIGSSAMAYKRNPMRSERICGLARFVMSLATSPPCTAATQWMERTLDDSANRRLVIPQAFLALDAILMLYENIVTGLTVYPQMIQRRLSEELPFLATEQLMMAAVSHGADRQVVHEIIRRHSLDAARRVKEQGLPNDLFARLAEEPVFAAVCWNELAEPRLYVGRAPEQVREFIDARVTPLLLRYGSIPMPNSELRV